VSVDVPADLRYTADHEWVLDEGGRARVGITRYAADALGDVVFVSLPEPGTKIEESMSFGEVESTKSVSDVYAPLSGTVVEVNTDLADMPQRVNEDPYGEGWICVIELADATSLESLMDAEAYRALIQD
jgi:glycine cleavage system H protein